MKSRSKYNIPFEISITDQFCFKDNLFQIKDFYDAAAPEELRKKYIQNIIDQCNEQGGGTVFINRGTWESGPIHLYNNICLEFEKGAEIHFSQKYEDYLPVVFTRWEGIECYNYSPFIYANGSKNIKITGQGRLVGGGNAWWHWKKLQGKAATDLYDAQVNGIPVESRVYGTEEAALRPSFVQFINCKNVCIEGVTIEEGPQWTLHPIYCENVIIRYVTIKTTGHNTDGLNPDSCKNVWIEGCTFSTGDDCIAINSGMNEDGWRVGKACENIVIVDCTMNGGHGAVTIGSGMSGGVHHVYVSNCNIKGTMQGIRIKSMRGRGGYVKNIWIEDLNMEDITNEAIQISMLYPYTTVPSRNPIAPDFSNIMLKNIVGNSKQLAIELRGLPEKKISHIELNHINLTAPKAISAENVDFILMDNVEIKGN